VDVIGIDAVHRTDFNYPHQPYEARARVAGTAANKRLAERIGREVEALGTNGPAGGGGFTRRVVEKIGIVSVLLPRDRVSSEVSIYESSESAQTA
jgi:hypothetical protein